MLTRLAENFTCFESLTDPRRPAGNLRHNLLDIIVLALCGTICFCDTWDEIEDFGNERIDWLKKYLTLENGIAGHDTIARVMSRLDTAEFFRCLQAWIDGLQLDLKGRGIHVDGKTARRSFDHDSNLKSLHMVSAWVDELSVCLGQLATDQKSNEITAIPLLLELLHIKGGVVTLDAMGCQEKIVKQIVASEADYVVTVRDNQPTLHREIVDAFVAQIDNPTPDFRSHSQKSVSRGRKVERVVKVGPVPQSIKDLNKWAGIKTIGMVYRHREPVNGDNPRAIKETDRVTYFISSLRPTASLLARYVHKHWSVENSLHWTLDVTFTDDRSRIRKGTAPAIMSSLRRFAISLLRRDTSMPKTSIKRKRKRAAMNINNLEAVLFGN